MSLICEVFNTVKSTSRHRTKMIFVFLSFIILGILFSSSLVENSNILTTKAFAQLSTNNNNNNVYSSNFPDNGPDTDKAPAFLDAYWTNYLSSSSSTSNNSVKKEVGPGDGTSTLAVVLVNKGRSDITGVTGYLNLPSSGGFTPIAGKNNGTSQSMASAYSIVKAGDTFVLYFDMNVLKQAKVDGYSTSLNLKYAKINQIGNLMTKITVPFRLTGKVILDAVSEISQLIPSTPNPLKILIQNKGSASASGVVVTVTGVTSGSIVTSNNTQNTGSSTSNTNSAVSTFSNTNTTNSPLQQSSSSPSSSNPAVTIGATTFNIGTISPNSSTAVIRPVVYPSSSSGETAQNLNIQITYGDAYGNQQTLNKLIGLIILPNPRQSVLNVTANDGNAITITAGKIQDMNFTLVNGDPKNPITNVVATLDSQSSSMKILGNSRWTLQSMLPQSKLNLSTKVFASANMIGQPAISALTLDYISAGQSKIDTLNIGAYVKGDIKIRAYDIGINFIGGKPNLVGNLLNEGNTVGLFTTVGLVKSSSGKSFISTFPPPQYLGDLSVDSPLPFSIPINSDNKTMSTIQPGTHPITLKITYSDDLKIPHELLVNSSVDFQPTQLQSGSMSSGISGGGGGLFGIGAANSSDKTMMFIVLIAIVIVVIAVLLVRKRRSKSKAAKLQSNKDADLFLNDIPSSTTKGPAADHKDKHGD
ncbi:MAG: hypothetical protein M3Z01_05315 [Thermoproteota archaeon]|nr:hypothetical protein [Thermoproteota archaeon]